MKPLRLTRAAPRFGRDRFDRFMSRLGSGARMIAQSPLLHNGEAYAAVVGTTLAPSCRMEVHHAPNSVCTSVRDRDPDTGGRDGGERIRGRRFEDPDEREGRA